MCYLLYLLMYCYLVDSAIVLVFYHRFLAFPLFLLKWTNTSILDILFRRGSFVRARNNELDRASRKCIHFHFYLT